MLSGLARGLDPLTRERAKPAVPSIEKMLHKGQEIIVQVLKEGISTKGPTLTTYLSIPGRYLVMLPQMDRVGVSRKVEDEEERKRKQAAMDAMLK